MKFFKKRINYNYMEEGGPMNGVNFGLLSNLNNTFNSIIKNLSVKRLKKETPTQQRIGVSKNNFLDRETSN